MSHTPRTRSIQGQSGSRRLGVYGGWELRQHSVDGSILYTASPYTAAERFNTPYTTIGFSGTTPEVGMTAAGEELMKEDFNEFEKHYAKAQKTAEEMEQAIHRVREENANATRRAQMLSTAESASIAGVSRDSVSRWIRNGLLPAKHLGGVYRINRGNLEDFLAERPTAQS